MIPPPLWKACDFALQLIFLLAHIPGRVNTTGDILSLSEINPNEKLVFKICEDVPKQTIEVNIQSTGITQEDQVFFNTDEAELPSAEQLWQRKQEKRNAFHTEAPVINISHCYVNEKCTNTLMQGLEIINKVPGKLFETKRRPRDT